MHYGHPPHRPSIDDLTIIYCKCGWCSPEHTMADIMALGAPWYCDRCRHSGSNIFWVRYHPRERDEAMQCVTDALSAFHLNTKRRQARERAVMAELTP